jgi:hypothetical protein
MAFPFPLMPARSTPAARPQKKAPDTQRMVADALGLTTRQVRNLTDEGHLPRTLEKGKPEYNVAACVQAYLKYKMDREAAKGGPGRDAIAQLNQRKLTLEVERAEFEFAQEREQLVTIDFMERQLTGVLQSLRSKILNFPGKFARELADATDPADVVEILEAATAELLESLSEAGEDPALDEAEEEPAREVEIDA